MKNEPSGALFPDPYVGPVAEPIGSQPTAEFDSISHLVNLAHYNVPLAVIVVCLVLYTRLVQGKPVNPLKWVGWARRGSRK